MYRFWVVFIVVMGIGFGASGALWAQNPADSSGEKVSIDKQAEADLLASMKAYQDKQFASALVYCERALAIESEMSSIAMLCLQLNIQADKHDRALELMAQLKAKDAGFAEREGFCFMEATLYTKLGRWDDARSAYRACEFEAPGERAVMLSNLAELSMIQGKVDEAVRAYDEALELLPENPHALFGSAVAWSRQGGWRQAQEQYLRGIEIDPNLRFLEDAFFVPDGEDAYHKAILALLGRDFRQARFLLTQYVEKEERLAYRDHGKSLLASLEAFSARGDSDLLASYPVLLSKVGAVAIDASGRYMAFIQGVMGSSLWVLDLEAGKVYERMSGTAGLLGLGFVGDSSVLRVVGHKSRYVLDARAADSGYYFYAMPDALRLLGFSADAGTVFVSGDESVQRMAFDTASNGDLGLVLVNNEMLSESSSVACTQGFRVCAFLVEEGLLLLNLEGDKFIKAFDDKVFQFGRSTPNVASPFRAGLVGPSMGAIAAHPSDAYFAAAYMGGVILFDKRGRVLRQFNVSGDTGASVLAFDPKGEKLVVVSGTLVEVHDLKRLLNDLSFPDASSASGGQ